VCDMCENTPGLAVDIAARPEILKARLLTDSELTVDPVDGVQEGDVTEMASCNSGELGQVVVVKHEQGDEVGLVLTPESSTFVKASRPTVLYRQRGKYRIYDGQRIATYNHHVEWTRPNQFLSRGRKLIKLNGNIYEVDTTDMAKKITGAYRKVKSIALKIAPEERRVFPLIYVCDDERMAQKFKQSCEILGYVGEAEIMSFTLIQGTQEEILRSKYNQAFERFQKPLFVEITCLSCSCLGGLPGAYLGSWLRMNNYDLTMAIRGETDRRAILTYKMMYGVDAKNVSTSTSIITGKLMLRKHVAIDKSRGLENWFKPKGESCSLIDLESGREQQYMPWYTRIDPMVMWVDEKKGPRVDDVVVVGESSAREGVDEEPDVFDSNDVDQSVVPRRENNIRRGQGRRGHHRMKRNRDD